MKFLTILTGLFLFTSLSLAQSRNFRIVKDPTETPTNQKRKAVVIGMSDYGTDKSLNNTLNDVDDMSKALAQLGFEVTILKNNDLKVLNTNLTTWYSSIEGNDMAIFYFAGHGMEIEGENYLVPIGAEFNSKSDAKSETMNVNRVLGNMDEMQVGMKLLILDACRNNPFTRSWNRSSSQQGLVGMSAPQGTYIAFAASPGSTATDGGNYNLRNGVFTNFLKREIVKEGVSIDEIFNTVSGSVSELTNEQQTPFTNSSLEGSFYFIPKGSPAPIPTPSPTPVENDLKRNTNTSFTVNGVSFEMISIRGGSFTMGCTSEQIDCDKDELPAHLVHLSDFYMGKYEVKQALWHAVMGSNPSGFKGDNLPVESVSWIDCQTFIAKLNRLTGVWFRLPTEAEWEYAARGGSSSRGRQYSGSANLYEVAWFKNSDGLTHEVGLLRPNELGLHDMSGNVWEWCSDWYGSYTSTSSTDPQGSSTGSYRILRGGSWNRTAPRLRVANRDDLAPDFRFINFGLRLVLVP